MSLLLRRGIFSGALSGFTPAEITTLAWWDASDTGTISGSPSVTSITDKSGNGHTLAQGSGSKQPQTGLRTLNGLNVLDFDGGDTLERNAFPVPSSGDVVFYGVFEIDVINSTTDALFSVDGGNDFQFDAGNSSSFRARVETGGIGSSVAASSTTFSGPSVYVLPFDFSDAGEYTAFIDTVENENGPVSYTTKLSASHTFRIMANRGDSTFPDGAFAEMVIVETADDRIETYLKSKWGTP